MYSTCTKGLEKTLIHEPGINGFLLFSQPLRVALTQLLMGSFDWKSKLSQAAGALWRYLCSVDLGGSIDANSRGLTLYK